MKSQDQEVERNGIIICGSIDSPLEFDHKVYGESFYKFYIASPRLSGTVDIIPITISERTIVCAADFAVGKYVEIWGQIRTRNIFSEIEGKRHLAITVFAKYYSTKVLGENPNVVALNGYICKSPTYRTTPFGREICDILLAVNRSYDKSDYIPCITWSGNARFASRRIVGDNIKVFGRLQSRVYYKQYEDGTIEDKTALEVSVSKIELM